MAKSKSEEFKFPISTLVGSSITNFNAVCNGKKIDSKYRSRFILSFLASLILDPIGRFENAYNHKKILNNYPEEPPVFIIGYWRSGTTYLHNLLCFDKSFAYASTFQGIFPNHTLWHKGWIGKFIEMLMPERRPVDHMKLNLNYPQEEEIALGNLQKLSFYNFFYFPNHFQQYLNDALLFENISPDEMDKWKTSYQNLIAKAIIKTGGKQFLSKSPSNTFRIDKILELFPEAKFIYLYRNPYKVLSSFNLFMAEVIKGVGFQKFDEKTHIKNLCDLYIKMLEVYNRDKHLIKPANLIELKYEDFITQPLKSIKEIYNNFRLTGFNQNESVFLDHIKDNKSHTSSQYNIDPQIKKFINENLAEYLVKNGYEKIN